jgi:hypothetical protein
MTDLVYVGGGRFMPGVPARDLTLRDIGQLARKRGETVAATRHRLIGSGLYRFPAKPKRKV